MVDKRNDVGQFILTGSNTVDESKIMHSGIGRISRIKMYPMSLYESQESNGSISLKELFDNPKATVNGQNSPMSIESLIYSACRGGWPASLKLNNAKAQLLVAKEYVNSICKVDMTAIDGIQRDEQLTRYILRSYARNISTLAKKSVLLRDVLANVENCSDKTFDNYTNALSRLFVIDNIEAWCPSVRSASAIRKGVKRELIDPSIAVAALGLTPEALQMDLKTFGFIFECMCIRDLRAYSQSLGSTISYYHDRYDLEADAVLRLDDGRYALIEFKLGSREIEEGARHLLEIEQLVKIHNEKEKQIKLREPDLLIVITGGPIAYTRPDGIQVIPLACLKD
jgi:predicted AAA+ superfamily ATPase